MPSSRYAAIVEYTGDGFSGWQKQRHCQQTVQHYLESALSAIADHPVNTVCAGRTDKGVHATCQVIHFDTTAERDSHQWLMGSNHFLPKAIRLKSILKTNERFHARFDAIERQYDYLISTQRSVFTLHRQTFIPHSLDVLKMQQASEYLIGEHDFSSFRASGCQSNHAIRHLKSVKITGHDAVICCQFRANAFLYHMVRNIMGSLIDIGKGLQQPSWMQTLLEAKDRTQGAATAAADGLYLTQIVYHPQYPSINQWIKQHCTKVPTFISL